MNPGGKVTGVAGLRLTFAQADFRNLFMANTAFTAAQWMQRVAFGWLLWSATESGTLLGLLAIAELAPGIVLSPLGGILADRFDRRHLAALTQGVAVLQSIATAIVIAVGLADPVLILLLAVVSGSAASLGETSRTLILRDAVPRECLPTALSLAAVSVNATRFLGPALAGLLIDYGAATIFWVNTAIGIALTIIVLRQPKRPVGGDRAERHILRAMVTGLKAVSGNRQIASVLAIFALTGLLVRPLYELLPGVSSEMFGGAVEGYVQLLMTIGLGALIGAILITLWTHDRPSATFALSSLGACIALGGVAIASDMAQATLACAILGFCLCISAARSQLILVTEASDAVSGRVLSLWNMLIRAGPALGALTLGAAMDFVGARTAFLAASGAALLLTLAPIFPASLLRAKPAAPVADSRMKS